MKTAARQRKTNTSASTKTKAPAGLNYKKSRIYPNKGAKQRLKAAGKSVKELGTECLLSPTPPMPPAFPTSIQGETSHSFQKFRLQLFPIDEATRRGLEMEKHNPFLELTIGTRKKISSVVKHLSIKWGESKMASGELMLFPYYAHPANLNSHRRWTLKDSNMRAADVHLAIGSPAMFRMRYGWFSDIEPKVRRVPLSPIPERSLENNHNQKSDTDGNEQQSCHVFGSSNQAANKPIQLDRMVEQVGSENSSVLLWDLSNISFGALLSEASKNANTNPIFSDTFDADIARYQATVQPTPLPPPSILDAEETRNPFCFQKTTSPGGTLKAESQDAPIASCIQNISSTLSRQQDMVGHTQENASDQDANGLQLRANSEACVQPTKPEAHLEASCGDDSLLGKLDMYRPDSVGHLEFAAPSSKQLVGGESIGLSGLIANSLDAFQNVSIF